METAAPAPKEKRRRAQRPASGEELAERVAELTIEVKGIKRMVMKTYDLLQRAREDKQALAPLFLAEIDPDDEEQMALYEAQALRRGRVRLTEELERLRKLGIVDEKGRLIPGRELPADMREGIHLRRLMRVVGGPPGSGKSTLFPISESGLDHFNVDDRCAELNGGPYQRIPPEIRARAGEECAAFIERCIGKGRSFAVESTFRTPIALEQAARARREGFAVRLVFVSTDDVEFNVERVTMRAMGGGHAASARRIRETYAASLLNFTRALGELESVTAYDNSRPGSGPRLVLRTRRGKVVFVAPDPPGWIRSALKAAGIAVS